jgi:ferritin-like metal-binding protein YciE
MTTNDKLLLYLNEALAVENAAIPRIQSRIKDVQLENVKMQLQHHLEETKEQQNRLKQLISSLGGKPTADRAQLPTIMPPKSLAGATKRSITEAEQELKGAKEDAIIENAEVVMYDTMVQLAQLMNAGDAIPVLTQNLNEEKEMADWLRANTPALVTQVYPEMESSLAGEEQRAAEA